MLDVMRFLPDTLGLKKFSDFLKISEVILLSEGKTSWEEDLIHHYKAYLSYDV